MTATCLWLGLLLIKYASSLRPTPLSSSPHRLPTPLLATSTSMEEDEALEALEQVEPPLLEDRLRYCARVMYDGSGFRCRGDGSSEVHG